MSVFVGRERELDWLEQRLSSAQEGRGRVIFITAEPGAGKSTLVSQFMVQAALRLPDARLIGAECSEQFGTAEPYQPVVVSFRDLIVGEEKTGGSRWSQLRDMATELAPAWIQVIPVAGSVIGAAIATATELKKGGVATAAASEEALFFQYTEIFFAAAAKSPIVLFIDDLHWADAASVSLLTHLARRIRDKPILIIGTYRPADVDVTRHLIREARLELERYGVAEELPLPPLDPRALASLVEEQLEAPATPEMLDWLTRHAGENPLFFTELMRWLVDQGHAVLQREEWALVRVPELIEVPRSAESAIERRLSRLEPDVYKILEYASVAGTEFDSTSLAQLLAMDELALEEAMEPVVKQHRLARLVETRDLPSGDIASIYQFSHSLVQDVLHNNLLGKRRILLHRKMAEALEKLYAKDLDQVASRLAFHYDEGRMPERVYEFALRGAERASRMYAHRDAIGLIRRALRNAQDDAQKLEAFDRLGDASRVVGNYPEALASLTEALGLSEPRQDLPRTLSLKRRLVEIEREHGGTALDRVRSSLEALAGEARAAGADEELCHILWRLNELPAQQEEEALARAHEAVDTARRLNNAEMIARAEFNIGRTLAFGHDPASAVPHIQESLRLYQQLDDRGRLGRCHTALGVANNRLGDFVRGAAEFRSAILHFEKAGDPVSLGLALNNLGVTLTRIGEWADAETRLRDAFRIMERLDAAARALHPLENLTELFYMKQEWSAVREHCRLLLDRARAIGYWSFEVVEHARLGLALLDEGDHTAAAEEERHAREILKQHSEWFDDAVYCDMLTAELAAVEGRSGDALRVLSQAETSLASRDVYLMAAVHLARGRVAIDVDVSMSQTLIREALAMFEKMGATPMQRRAQALLTTLGDSA
jgi:tetratricopeptide (TPR) repeat protein